MVNQIVMFPFQLIEYIDIDVYGTCTNHNQKYTSKGSVADMGE